MTSLAHSVAYQMIASCALRLDNLPVLVEASLHLLSAKFPLALDMKVGRCTGFKLLLIKSIVNNSFAFRMNMPKHYLLWLTMPLHLFRVALTH
jgi:hypothetical protein